MKILVVEDNAIIGYDLVAMLEDWGYVAKGPLPSNEEALAEIAAFVPDAVILDIQLKGGVLSDPVADDLTRRGIPFLCLTGFDSDLYDQMPAFADVPHLEKPMGNEALRNAIQALLGSRCTCTAA
ncbi:MAG: response regulator [Silicimonas sp.]|nr:response regulator [Silicimonas sp.]NNF90075.1 response regulator [Boseongicola sp.]RZW00177.1 MAG: response regulator [Paracoccaceae bacterium]MBT8424132.1 response regulator [Silicimonas sp.]NND18118.1 response regulator [Silicimonas sp.]